MVDNVAITPGAGVTVAADDIGSGVLAQRVKPVWGPDGTGNDVDVASGKALPTQIRSATGLTPIGEPTDAKVTATDTTSVSMISILKQVSASIQAFAAAIANTTSTGWLAVNLRKADGTEITFNGNGPQPPVNSAPVVPADQYGAYETVAASQTDQAMGATGAAGDYLAGVLIVPSTAAAGVVSIKDGSGSAITVFAGGGTTALPSLVPFLVPLGLFSTSGAWKITTGTNVSAVGIGKFT